MIVDYSDDGKSFQMPFGKIWFTDLTILVLIWPKWFQMVVAKVEVVSILAFYSDCKTSNPAET